MVGMTRFERATPSSQAKCATKLRYIPTVIIFYFQVFVLSELLPLLGRYLIFLVGRVKLRYIPTVILKNLRPARFERATLCLEGRCSIQLSYGRIYFYSIVNSNGSVRKPARPRLYHKSPHL